MAVKNPRFGKAFLVRTAPNGGHVALFNRVERGKVGKSGAHVEFTYVWTQCFRLGPWLTPARKLSLAQGGTHGRLHRQG